MRKKIYSKYLSNNSKIKFKQLLITFTLYMSAKNNTINKGAPNSIDSGLLY